MQPSDAFLKCGSLIDVLTRSNTMDAKNCLESEVSRVVLPSHSVAHVVVGFCCGARYCTQMGAASKDDILETTVAELVSKGMKLFVAKRLIKFVFGQLRDCDVIA
jgi:hypothetical protein